MVKKIKPQPIRRKREQMYEEVISQLSVDVDSQTRMLRDIISRMSSIESFLMENIEEFTPESHALRMVSLQDKARGYEPAAEVEQGDLVRVDLRFRMSSQESFEDQNEIRRVELTCIGSGRQYPKDFENNLIGLKVAEEKTFSFLEPNLNEEVPVTCWVKVVTISRKIKKEKPSAD